MTFYGLRWSCILGTFLTAFSTKRPSGSSIWTCLTGDRDGTAGRSLDSRHHFIRLQCGDPRHDRV